MKIYTGIDLHSSNNYLVHINEDDKILLSKRLPNDFGTIKQYLDPYKESIAGIVVESTYNWYWLADKLLDAGYPVHLANPSAIQQYSGLKYTDDKWDSRWLANMLRLKILPEGYIYPKELRSVRDLLRRRLLFVKQRTAHILSLQSTIARNLGIQISGSAIKKLTEDDINSLFDDYHLRIMAQCNLSAIRLFDEKDMQIGKEVIAHCKLKNEFKRLLTIPGIGNILAMTIMLEVGDIRRFPTAGDYISYCRCVKSEKYSNNKKKGKNNAKNGNRYLSWAYVEAANYCIRYCKKAEIFYQRKHASSQKKALAIKALSSKLARASYYIMRDDVIFDEDKLFA